ncbi:MAG: acetate/propionate family kinase [Mariprofundaceae bacterium]
MSNQVILVINSGSSSVKIALVEVGSGKLQAEELFECSEITAKAMQAMLKVFLAEHDTTQVCGVGHRVVHGGERFIKPTKLNADVIAEIEANTYLAPLHNPANLQGIDIAMLCLPDVPHIAVFDTAFHHTMPSHANLYAVPYSWYEDYGVRRYGFHGTSHHYVAQKAADILGRDFKSCHFITAHLGNGCSATAIAGGMSVDTTMGMTPLEGLVMGTRSGDIDPSLLSFMVKQTGQSVEQLTAVLNKGSGLLGLSGLSHDMRALLQAAEQGHERAALAIDIFCYRLAKSLAALTVPLGHLDGIIFTGGIGEHAHVIRFKTIQHLRIFGLCIDENRNQKDGKESQGFIHAETSKIPILVVATSEEKMIASYVCKAVNLGDNVL